jgi:hypothetical protein
LRIWNRKKPQGARRAAGRRETAERRIAPGQPAARAGVLPGLARHPIRDMPRRMTAPICIIFCITG